VVRESKTENLSEIPYVVGSTQNGMKFVVLLQEEKLVGESKFGKWKEGQLCLPNLSAALILGVAFHGLPRASATPPQRGTSRYLWKPTSNLAQPLERPGNGSDKAGRRIAISTILEFS
jgi:hypothetical protein